LDAKINGRWAGHVARMGEKRNIYKILIVNLKERYYAEDVGIDGRIILK
jgi:hypothetical protein